jgi:hypothetical protein
MKKLTMDNIDIVIHYKSGFCNGWPLIHFRINQQWIDTFEANSDRYLSQCQLDQGPVTLTLEHWGKNPIHDTGNSDKFIHVVAIDINGVRCPWLLSDSRKIVEPTPWTRKREIITGDTWLGHNGSMNFYLQSPVNTWLKKQHNQEPVPLQGQQTTREVLQQAKRFFRIQQTL